MAADRYFVTVDIRARQGNLADTVQFEKRHPEAAKVFLRDGTLSYYLAVFTDSADAAGKRVVAWAQECFASPRYTVTVRKVEHSPMQPPADPEKTTT